MTNITLLFNWMGQGWDWIDKWRKAHRFLQRVVRVHVCVCELRGSRASRLTGHSTLCNYLISCLSAAHVWRVWLSPAATCTPGGVFPEMLCEEKVMISGVWILPLKPPHSFHPFPYHRRGETLPWKVPSKQGLGGRVLSHLFSFIQIYFKIGCINRAEY